VAPEAIPGVAEGKVPVFDDFGAFAASLR